MNDTTQTIDIYTFKIITGGLWHEHCPRCAGTGEYPSQLWDGRCMLCRGDGLHGKPLTEAAARKVVARRVADRARRQATKRAQLDQRTREAAAWREAHRDLVNTLTPYTGEAPEGATRERVALGELARTATTGQLTQRETADATQLLDTIRAQEQRATESRHAGSIGEKITVTGIVTVAMTVDGDYGLQRMLVITGRDADAGVTVKAYSTAKAVWALDKGQQVTISGTVKRHATYQGVAQTVLARIRLG